MSKRWAVANDPKLLERIKVQERAKTQKPGSTKKTTDAPANGISAKAKQSNAMSRIEKVAEQNRDSRFDFISFSESDQSLTIGFVSAMLISLNVSLRMHDAKSTILKSIWQERVRALVLTNRPVCAAWLKHVKYPVIVEEIYATTEANCLDVESVTAGCKPIIDALVKGGLLPDDSPKYVAQPIGFTYRQPRGGVVITLRQTDKPWGAINDQTIRVAEGL